MAWHRSIDKKEELDPSGRAFASAIHIKNGKSGIPRLGALRITSNRWPLHTIKPHSSGISSSLAMGLPLLSQPKTYHH